MGDGGGVIGFYKPSPSGMTRVAQFIPRLRSPGPRFIWEIYFLAISLPLFRRGWYSCLVPVRRVKSTVSRLDLGPIQSLHLSVPETKDGDDKKIRGKGTKSG